MNRLLYFLLVAGGTLKAQTLTVGTKAASCLAFKQHVYAAGFNVNEGKLSLSVFKLDASLKKLDSLTVNCGRASTEDYQRTSLDTLHGFVHVYVQKKGSPEVRVLRLNPDLKIVADLEKTEVARLHNRTMLGVQPYYSGGRVYSIRSVNDTSGAQFYLLAYELKSDQENFDYLQRWQFAFERKNVSAAIIIHADSRLVTMYVEVDKGPKQGEWILSVNAKTGALLRGSKLNTKGETLKYTFGAAKADSLNGVLHLIGEKQLRPAPSKPLPAHTFYYLKVDSLGEISSRFTFAVPVTEQKRGSSKTPPSFKIAFEELRTVPTGIEATADVYMNNEIVKGCYNYCATSVFSLSINGEDISAGKHEIRSNRLIEDWLYLQDKGRMNGRLCSDSIGDNRRIFHASLPFPVKAGFRKEKGASLWLLRKTETARSRLSFAKIVTVKNALTVENIAELPKSFEPLLLILPGGRFVIGSDDKEGNLLLQAGNW